MAAAAAASVASRMRALRLAKPRALTAEKVAQFDADGFLTPVASVLTPRQVKDARGALEAMEAAQNQSGNSLGINGHLLHKWQHDLATGPVILDIVQDLIGPNFFIWKSQFWIKEPSSKSYIGWHQDAAYWGLAPFDSVNVWIALSNVTSVHGPMEFYKGSHAKPLLQHEDDYDPANMLTRGQVIPSLEESRDAALVVPAVLRPGECSIHHLCTAHGGGPNKGNDRRIGFNVTYCASHVVNVHRGGCYGQPARGVMPAGSPMQLDPTPLADTPSEANKLAHRRKMEGMSESIMEGSDLARFAAVSEARVGKNLPSHVDAAKASSTAATSLASSLLSKN